MQEMIKISKKKFEAMEEELAMLRNPQVGEEIKKVLRPLEKVKAKNSVFNRLAHGSLFLMPRWFFYHHL